MKVIILVVLSVVLMLSSPVTFAGDKARSIMEKVDARDDGTSMVSIMQMT
jgi:hypothetical protein